MTRTCDWTSAASDGGEEGRLVDTPGLERWSEFAKRAELAESRACSHPLERDREVKPTTEAKTLPNLSVAEAADLRLSHGEVMPWEMSGDKV